MQDDGKSARGRLRRGLAIVLIALAVAGPARAQTLNPLGRTIELNMPLREGGFYLGDIPVRITADDQVSVPGEPLIALIGRLLSPDALAELRSRIDADGRLTPADVEAVGLNFVYDPGLLELRVGVPAAQRGRTDLQVRGTQRPPSPQAAEPAALSAYVNMFAGVDYVTGDGSDNGWSGPRIDLDGATRAFGTVVEAETTADLEEGTFERRGTRMVYDDVARVLRLRAGDLRMPTIAFQNSRDTAGVGIERSWFELQPGRITRPLGSQAFSLDSPATVDLYVNGRTVQRFRLQPGNYDIRDFPLAAGANDVELVVEDEAGRVEVLRFDLFFASTLLAPGLDEFALTAGIAAPLQGGSRHYDTNEPQISGFYRRGLLPTLTLGGNAQADRHARVAGLSGVTATGIGNFAGDIAGSQSDHGGGVAAGVDYDLHLGLAPGQLSRIVRLAAETRSRDFRAIGSDQPSNPVWLDLAASYSQSLPLDVGGTLRGRYGFGRDGNGDRWGAGAGLARAFGRWGLNLNGGYDHGGPDDGLGVFVQATYSFAPLARARSSYDSRRQRARLSYSQSTRETLGGTDLFVEGVRTKDEVSLDGSVGYTANRADLSLSHDTRFEDLDGDTTDHSTRLRIASALAFADGAVAPSRPIANSFAIVRPYENLEGRRVFLTRSFYGDEARSDLLGPPVANSLGAYSNQVIAYDIEDLPIGYDLGAGLFEVFPPYRGGYSLTIGSDYTVTVVGTLLDARGDPVTLLTGRAIDLAAPEHEPVMVFTNRVGRFGAQGLRPGRWQIRMNTTPATLFELEVPDNVMGLYRAGELRPAAVEDKRETGR